MDHGQFYAALGVFWVFGFVAVILIAWNLRAKRRHEKLKIIHEERMRAMEKGIPPPEFTELDEEGHGVTVKLVSGSLNPRWPLGVGALLVTGGVGLMVAMMMSARAVHNELSSFGLLFIFLGVGFFFFYALTRGGRPKD